MKDQDISESPWSLQDALVALMVATSISDERIRTLELLSIERIVNHLPIFGNYADDDRLNVVSQTVADLFEDEDGLDAFFGLVKNALPERFIETAYALCCDVAASDGRTREGELRFLEEMRYELAIDRLAAAAIERGARARHLME
ncbi:MAG: tellurite resistance TerB family protein [Pseudomonadota bacterium]